MQKLLIYLVFTTLTCGTLSASAQVSEDITNDPLFNQAIVDQASGDHKSAIKILRKDLKTAANNRFSIVAALVKSLKATSQWDEAFQMLSREIEKSPFNGEFKLLLSQTRYEHGDLEKGLEQVEFAERLMTSDPKVLRLKALLLQGLNRHTDALVAFTKILELNKTSADALILRAKSYSALGEPAKAYEDLKSAYDNRPYDEVIVGLYLQSALAIQKYPEVKKVAQKCIEQFPNNYVCRESLANAFFEKKEYQQAISNFKVSLALNPKNMQSRLRLAEASGYFGDSKESDRQFNALLTLSPDNEAGIRSWAKFLYKRNDNAEAGKQLSLFNKNNPKNLWAAVELTKMLSLVGQQSQAIAVIENCVKGSRTDAGYLFLANIYDHFNKTADAVSALKDIREPSVWRNFDLGVAYFKLEKMDRAISEWSKIEPASPIYFKAQVNIASAYTRKGEFQKATDVLSKMEVPESQKSVVTDELSILAEKSREPAAEKSKTPHPLQPYLDWELPTL
ncbi:MAG: tetratricopeptide repeat protein [Bdellovibrionaceae bacterium]|nr:tetratricopeptide repeat protein [Pseudobdellovibrionaceae bacterium]